MSSNHGDRTRANRSTSSLKDTGSQTESEPVFLAVGRLRKPHGLTGELSMDVLTDFPERLVKGKEVFLGEAHQPAKIAGTRAHKNMLLVRFEGISDLTAAEPYRNLYLYVKASDLPALPEGDLYQYQVIGMQAVLSASGETVGTIVDILETGANDVYIIVTPQGQELLIPAVPAFVERYEAETNKLYVNLAEDDRQSLMHGG